MLAQSLKNLETKISSYDKGNDKSCWLKDEHSATKRIIFTYPMVAYTDMEESLKTDVLEICTNACEKYINDNQSVSRWNALEY